MTIDWSSPPIKPEAGKRYVTRDGTITHPISSTPMGGLYDKESGQCWFQSGSFEEEPCRHPLDLIKVYEPIVRKGWTNIYREDQDVFTVYTTPGSAEYNNGFAARDALRVAVPVTITEGH